MAAHMFDLPGTPSFPVYGLDDSFDGYRWLVLWNSREHLYEVSLGHGHPDDGRVEADSGRGEWLTVSTFAKTPVRRNRDGAVSTGPTGYNDALFVATLTLAQRAYPDRSQAGTWLAEEDRKIEWGAADRRGTPVSHGPEWTEATVTVDGEPRPSMTRRHRGWWAHVVDLPTVALTVDGLNSMSDLILLTDVRDGLATYQ